MPEYIDKEGYKHWYITDYNGPWQVAATSCYPPDKNNWYIVNIETGKIKMIGPVKLKGRNFCDRAKEEAQKRNKDSK